MKFVTIYQRVLALWPSRIDISDGRIIDDGNPTPSNCPAGEELYSFPSLDKAWNEAEMQIDPEKDTFGDMMIWTMFQKFHREAKKMLCEGVTYLKPQQISVESLEKMYRENLQTEEWEAEREEYEASNH